MPGRHSDHLLWAMDHLLVVLSDEGLGTHYQASHVGVLVQDMDVEVRGDAVDVLV